MTIELETSRMIEFDEEKHLYTVEGKVYPSVTSILGKLGVAESYEGIDEELLRARTARGKRIHRAIELYNRGLLDMASVNEDDRLFVEGYLKFTQDFPGWKSIMQERSFYARFGEDADRGELGYCGRIDDISLIEPGRYTIAGRDYNIGPNCIAIFDDKTSASIVPSYRFQVGGGYLWGLANGVDGNDLDMPLKDSIAHLIGGEIEQVFCFIRHLRKGHYFLIPVAENETYNIWEKMLLKYFYPETRGIDIEKLVKNQIDIPLDLARRIIRTKMLKDSVEEKYKKVGEEVARILERDGMTYNGVAEVDGYRVTYSKSFSGWSESIDKDAFIRAILSTPADQKISGKEINELYGSFKVGREVEGTWRRTVRKISRKNATLSEKDSIKETSSTEKADNGVVVESRIDEDKEAVPAQTMQTSIFDVSLNDQQPQPKKRGRKKKTEVNASVAAPLATEKPDTQPQQATPIPLSTDNLLDKTTDDFPSTNTLAQNTFDKAQQLALQLKITVMETYKMSEIQAQEKIVDFCRKTFHRGDYLSFDEAQMRDLISKMGAAMAEELLTKKPEKKPQNNIDLDF